MEIVILIVKTAILVAIAGSISSATAYTCLKGRRIKKFAATNIGYWCAAALLMTVVFYRLDFVHFTDALIAVAPLILIPGIFLLLCVSGSLTRRAVMPIAFVAALVAFPVTIYASLTASCYVLKTADTCIIVSGKTFP